MSTPEQKEASSIRQAGLRLYVRELDRNWHVCDDDDDDDSVPAWPSGVGGAEVEPIIRAMRTIAIPRCHS